MRNMGGMLLGWISKEDLVKVVFVQDRKTWGTHHHMDVDFGLSLHEHIHT